MKVIKSFIVEPTWFKAKAIKVCTHHKRNQYVLFHVVCPSLVVPNLVSLTVAEASELILNLNEAVTKLDNLVTGDTPSTLHWDGTSLSVHDDHVDALKYSIRYGMGMIQLDKIGALSLKDIIV